MNFLTPRECKVLILRMGYSYKGKLFLREIGEILGVSTERVRQIEAKAIRKIIRNSKED